MKLKPFFRMLTVEQLERVADADKWDRQLARLCRIPDRLMDLIPEGIYDLSGFGCLICHVTGNRYHDEIERHPEWIHVERRYMHYACFHGDAKAGRLMTIFARHELARRTLNALTPESSVLEVAP